MNYTLTIVFLLIQYATCDTQTLKISKGGNGMVLDYVELRSRNDAIKLESTKSSTVLLPFRPENALKNEANTQFKTVREDDNPYWSAVVDLSQGEPVHLRVSFPTTVFPTPNPTKRPTPKPTNKPTVKPTPKPTPYPVKATNPPIIATPPPIYHMQGNFDHLHPEEYRITLGESVLYEGEINGVLDIVFHRFQIAADEGFSIKHLIALDSKGLPMTLKSFQYGDAAFDTKRSNSIGGSGIAEFIAHPSDNDIENDLKVVLVKSEYDMENHIFSFGDLNENRYNFAKNTFDTVIWRDRRLVNTRRCKFLLKASESCTNGQIVNGFDDGTNNLSGANCIQAPRPEVDITVFNALKASCVEELIRNYSPDSAPGSFVYSRRLAENSFYELEKLSAIPDYKEGYNSIEMVISYMYNALIKYVPAESYAEVNALQEPKDKGSLLSDYIKTTIGGDLAAVSASFGLLNTYPNKGHEYVSYFSSPLGTSLINPAALKAFVHVAYKGFDVCREVPCDCGEVRNEDGECIDVVYTFGGVVETDLVWYKLELVRATARCTLINQLHLTEITTIPKPIFLSHANYCLQTINPSGFENNEHVLVAEEILDYYHLLKEHSKNNLEDFGVDSDTRLDVLGETVRDFIFRSTQSTIAATKIPPYPISHYERGLEKLRNDINTVRANIQTKATEERISEGITKAVNEITTNSKGEANKIVFELKDFHTKMQQQTIDLIYAQEARDMVQESKIDIDVLEENYLGNIYLLDNTLVDLFGSPDGKEITPTSYYAQFSNANEDLQTITTESIDLLDRMLKEKAEFDRAAAIVAQKDAIIGTISNFVLMAGMGFAQPGGAILANGLSSFSSRRLKRVDKPPIKFDPIDGKFVQRDLMNEENTFEQALGIDGKNMLLNDQKHWRDNHEMDERRIIECFRRDPMSNKECLKLYDHYIRRIETTTRLNVCNSAIQRVAYLQLKEKNYPVEETKPGTYFGKAKLQFEVSGAPTSEKVKGNCHGVPESEWDEYLEPVFEVQFSELQKKIMDEANLKSWPGKERRLTKANDPTTIVKRRTMEVGDKATTLTTNFESVGDRFVNVDENTRFKDTKIRESELKNAKKMETVNSGQSEKKSEESKSVSGKKKIENLQNAIYHTDFSTLTYDYQEAYHKAIANADEATKQILDQSINELDELGTLFQDALDQIFSLQRRIISLTTDSTFTPKFEKDGDTTENRKLPVIWDTLYNKVEMMMDYKFRICPRPALVNHQTGESVRRLEQTMTQEHNSYESMKLRSHHTKKRELLFKLTNFKDEQMASEQAEYAKAKSDYNGKYLELFQACGQFKALFKQVTVISKSLHEVNLDLLEDLRAIKSAKEKKKIQEKRLEGIEGMLEAMHNPERSLAGGFERDADSDQVTRTRYNELMHGTYYFLLRTMRRERVINMFEASRTMIGHYCAMYNYALPGEQIEGCDFKDFTFETSADNTLVAMADRMYQVTTKFKEGWYDSMYADFSKGDTYGPFDVSDMVDMKLMREKGFTDSFFIDFSGGPCQASLDGSDTKLYDSPLFETRNYNMELKNVAFFFTDKSGALITSEFTSESVGLKIELEGSMVKVVENGLYHFTASKLPSRTIEYTKAVDGICPETMYSIVYKNELGDAEIMCVSEKEWTIGVAGESQLRFSPFVRYKITVQPEFREQLVKREAASLHMHLIASYKGSCEDCDKDSYCPKPRIEGIKEATLPEEEKQDYVVLASILGVVAVFAIVAVAVVSKKYRQVNQSSASSMEVRKGNENVEMDNPLFHENM